MNRLEMESALDPNIYQIGYAGKDAIKECFDNRDYGMEKIKTFINEFRAMRRLRFESTQAPLKILQMGGKSETRSLNEILKIVIDTMKRDINTLPHDKLERLLESSFTYLTVPQLAPVPIATLERTNVVDPNIWKQIVDNGLNDSPYIDLPLSIKKRIWSFEPKALDHEIDALIDRLPEISPPTVIEGFVVKPDRQRIRAANPLLIELLRMLKGMGQNEVLQVIEKMVERTSVEQVGAKRDAIANFFHDLLLRLSPNASSSPSVITLRKMAKLLDTIASHDTSLDTHLLQDIREAISAEGSTGAVALLVASTYSRDLLAEQLVYGLISRRGPISEWEDADMLKAASAHLKADPHIQDLTYLNICNMKASIILSGNCKVTESELEEPFQLFFQLMMDEIHTDITHLHDSYASSNVGLPNMRLVDAMQKGRLQRKVLTSYCLQQCVHGNIIALSRYRLLLEDVLRACDNTVEPREAVLAYQLILKVVEA